MPVSRPLLIVLVATIGFAGVWLIVLRPHASSDTTPPRVGDVSHATRDPNRPKVAETGAVAAKPVAATPAATKAAAEPAAPKAAASTAGVTVLLFAGQGADDAVARQVVRSVRRPGVRTIIASIDDVARYSALLGTLQVQAAPTILVIGADHAAQQITGLPDRAVVEQAIAARSAG
jgi:hypothetical protein